MVKYLNRTLCESLAKVKENDDWDLYIPAVLLAYQTKKHVTIGYILFQLVYRWQAVLLIEALLLIEPHEETEYNLQNSILHRAFELIDKLPKLLNNAKEKTNESQQKQKEYFDAKIHPETFEIDDKVWIIRKDIEHSQSAKFKNKKTEPFIIQEKLNNRVYKLCNNKEKTLQKHYNSD